MSTHKSPPPTAHRAVLLPPPKEEHTLQLPLFSTLFPFRAFFFFRGGLFLFSLSGSLTSSLSDPRLWSPGFVLFSLSTLSRHLSHRCLRGGPGFDPVLLCRSFQPLTPPQLQWRVEFPSVWLPCPVADGHRGRRDKGPLTSSRWLGLGAICPCHPSHPNTKAQKYQGAPLPPPPTPPVTPINQMHYLLLLLNYDCSLKGAEKAASIILQKSVCLRNRSV